MYMLVEAGSKKIFIQQMNNEQWTKWATDGQTKWTKC